MTGNFISQLHLGALLLAELHGRLTLPRESRRMAGKSIPRRSLRSARFEES
jgi:hypothetical protein